MPNSVAAKIKSAPKLRITLAVWLVATTAILAIVWFAFHATQTAALHTPDHNYSLIVASTPSSQAKGLGDRASLPANQGMLFTFSGQAIRCFWMKDMRFSLDIIWLSAGKKVVHLEPGVSPATYPKAFCPSQPAQYVIELNAGQAKVAGITTGQTLNF